MSEPDYKVPTKAQRRICLIVVDMQNCFFNENESPKGPYMEEIETMAEAIRLFHEHSREVIMIRYVGETHSGSTDMRFIDELGEVEPCTVVEKHHMSSFLNTQLADIIMEKGYDAALICGAYAEYCVMATYWGANDHEITPFLLSGGVIAYSKEKGESAENICSTYNMDEVLENLRTATIDPEYNRTSNRMRRKYYYVQHCQGETCHHHH